MGEKKEIHCKFTYRCGICGEEFDNILDRANCEIKCVRKTEEAARKAEEEKKAAEKAMRKDAVDEAFENLHRLVTEFVKDYGHYEYGDGGHDTNFHWPTSLWHRFWD